MSQQIPSPAGEVEKGKIFIKTQNSLEGQSHAVASKTCCIFGAGEYGNLGPVNTDNFLIIAADGGYEELSKRGIAPDLLVGDFDSLSSVPRGVEIIRHPPMKDETDMFLAAGEGIRRGCKRFKIYGGLGGRLDHTIANIHLLTWLANRGALGYLMGEGVTLTVIREAALRFEAGYTGLVSVFCAGDRAQGVTLTGLKYPLQNAQVECDFPIGVSNEFTGKEALISVNEGALLVSWIGNCGKPLPEICL